MHNTVLQYVRTFYHRAKKSIAYSNKHFGHTLTVDEFFKNWTVNFNNHGSDYRLWGGEIVDEHLLLKLVHDDSREGFFERNVQPCSVHYRLTELGKQYILMKLEL